MQDTGIHGTILSTFLYRLYFQNKTFEAELYQGFLQTNAFWLQAPAYAPRVTTADSGDVPFPEAQGHSTPTPS